jgi:hypothetical protein
MPGQYSSEPPWWLLLAGPDSYLFRGHTIEEFVATYEPRLEQFLQAMQRAERVRGTLHGEKPLSSLMRESWLTKRFWFNYVAWKPFDVEVLFDNCLNEGGASVESLDEEARAGLEPFVQIPDEDEAVVGTIVDDGGDEHICEVCCRSRVWCLGKKSDRNLSKFLRYSLVSLD